jgi:hypothetical protein
MNIMGEWMEFFRGSRVKHLSELAPKPFGSEQISTDTASNKSSRKAVKKAAVVISMIMVVGFVFNIASVSVPTKCTDTNRAQHCIDKYYVLDVLRGHHTGLDLVSELKLADVIVVESRRYKIEPALILALIETESTYYNWAKSRVGARGLMQVVPRTGKYLAQELELEWEGIKTLYDPYTNVKLGVHYLAELLERFDGDTDKALAAYNIGPTYIASRIRRGKSLPVRYSDKVMAKYNSHKGNIVF